MNKRFIKTSIFSLLTLFSLSACGVNISGSSNQSMIDDSSSTGASSETSSASSESEVSSSEEETTSNSESESSSSEESTSIPPLQTYIITWKDDTGTVLKTDTNVASGDTPTFGTSDPTKESTVDTEYTFSRWNPEVVPAYEDAVYTAVFTPSTRKYNITWLNDNDSLIRTDQVAYGDTPSFGTDPVKDATAAYYYTFEHWDNEVVPVTGPATYKAVYSSSLRSYTVTWKDDNGTTLDTEVVDYGVTPSYKGSTPTKESTVQYTYEFEDWSPTISSVSGDITYTATYNPTVRTYAITWLDEDDSELRTDQVEYGTIPDYGTTPSKASTTQYTYPFTGWTPAVTSVTGPATYKATYGQNVRAYTVTWKNYDNSTLRTDSVNYGVTPNYVGSTPTKPDDTSYTYSFVGWSPTITAVTGNVTYTAQYNQTAKPAGKLPDTVYFSNNKNWLDVYAYVWNTNSDKLAAWPGTKMTFHKINPEGEKVYKISGVSQYANIIFTNNSGDQSHDFAYTSITGTNNAFYLGNKTDNKYQLGQWYESGVLAPSYNFATKGQNILHCFDWSISTIIDNLDAIAEQGFNAIQTSPIQPVKDYTESYNDTNESWWRFYQPVGLCIANSTTNILFSTSNGASELTTLSTEAAKRGIRVVVDVIVNHLADGTGNGGLNTQVNQFNPEIYSNYTSTLHNPYSKVPVDTSKGAIGITQSDAFGKDLNTANSTVQSSVYNFLKSLVDCGVTGFRFDAAKHIETSNDAYCGSSFWENTLGAVTTYASTTYSRGIWSYGEIINPTDGGRSYQQYINDAWFYAVTAQPGWHGLSAQNCVSWGESHDDYMGEGHHTTSTGQDVINNSYTTLARASKDTNLLYFVRPVVDGKVGQGVGYHADWGWQNGDVKSANFR